MLLLLGVKEVRVVKGVKVKCLVDYCQTLAFIFS